MPPVVLRARPLDPDVVAANAAEVQLVDIFASASAEWMNESAINRNTLAPSSVQQTFCHFESPDPHHLFQTQNIMNSIDSQSINQWHKRERET